MVVAECVKPYADRALGAELRALASRSARRAVLDDEDMQHCQRPWACERSPLRPDSGAMRLESCVPGDAEVLDFERAPLWRDGATVDALTSVLTRAEAQYLISAADRVGSCQRSKVSAKGGSAVSETRTSTTCFLPKGADPVISCIERKLARVAGRPQTHLEPLQLTKYTRGQQYRPHFDWFADPDKEPGKSQRTTTLFAYLQGCDPRCGGATVFSELKPNGGPEPLRVRPVTGNAVLFENLHADGRGNEKTRHGGEPVLCADAEKVGLNAWFRSRAW